MPIFALDDSLHFPPTHLAEGSGLLAMGGDLSPERLMLAYKSGIFPWYEKPPILWWSPDPRFVLFPDEFRVNKTVKALLKKNYFDFTINQSFDEVINHCKKIYRPGQEGTWITNEVKIAYSKLHEMGIAQSAEVWLHGKLVGGLYGVLINHVFFGESMFSLVSNASRYAFAKYMQHLRQLRVQLIDCQIHSDYLESMGAKMITGSEFQQYLKKWVN